MSGGPKPIDRARRLQLAYEIAEQVQQHYHEHVLAIGVYGSVARGTDGPYSDIEMHCILRGEGIETTHEWSAGAWKAEVNVYSEDVALGLASQVDGDWSITHGAFTHILAIFDPTGFFARLREMALSQPDAVFRQTLRDVIVGELYERIGKIRNARAVNNDAGLPYFAVELAKFGACLIGLANRHLYTTTSHLFEESLVLPGRPDGYDPLCRMVMAGELTDATRVADASDAFWLGIEKWATIHRIRIEEALVQHGINMGSDP